MKKFFFLGKNTQNIIIGTIITALKTFTLKTGIQISNKGLERYTWIKIIIVLNNKCILNRLILLMK